MIKLKNNSTIQWDVILNKTISFLNKNLFQLAIFFVLFSFLTIPDQLDFLSWNNSNLVHIWIYAGTILSFLTVSYFVSVVFILWVANQSKSKKTQNFKKIFQSSLFFLIPLSILSVRGALLFSLGLLALIFPGLYFYFKYSLASFCLILEGWNNNISPIMRAEQIIIKYRFALIPLIVLSLLESFGLSALSIFLRWIGIDLNIYFKIGSSLLQAFITTFYYMYMTFFTLLLIDEKE